MSIWDDRILEYIFTNRSGSPSEIAQDDRIHVTESDISHRLQALDDHDLIESLGNGVYTVTKRGRHYLAGEYDAEAGEFVGSGDVAADLRELYDERADKEEIEAATITTHLSVDDEAVSPRVEAIREQLVEKHTDTDSQR